VRRVGILVHPRWEAAQELGRQLEIFLRRHIEEVWLSTAWDEKATQLIVGTDLLVCVGGDGTVLWAARSMVPHRVPIVGVSMGRLAFLAEVQPHEAQDCLLKALQGGGRLEERWLLQATLRDTTTYGLNDVVVGRSHLGRPIDVEVALAGQSIALYRADAVIVATATGSTAYSLSAGGPILPPESRDLVITPVAPHMAASRSIVLPPDSLVSLCIRGEFPGYMSVDGQDETLLPPGQVVQVATSPYWVPFLRLSPPYRDYLLLAQRLGWNPFPGDLNRRPYMEMTEEAHHGPQ